MPVAASVTLLEHFCIICMGAVAVAIRQHVPVMHSLHVPATDTTAIKLVRPRDPSIRVLTRVGACMPAHTPAVCEVDTVRLHMGSNTCIADTCV